MRDTRGAGNNVEADSGALSGFSVRPRGWPAGQPRRPDADPAAAKRQLEQRIGVLIQAWIDAVAHITFVPGGRAQVRAVLEDSLRRLLAALTAEPFDPAPGYAVGFELVSSRITHPRALGNTITLLGQQLVHQLGISHRQAPARLSALLGQLACGFTEALRNVALSNAEDIGRARLVALREQQANSDRRLQQAMLTERTTGLPNRVRLMTKLAEILAEPAGCPRLGVCLVNLDRFKAVNESLGYDRCDELLRAVAHRLRAVAAQHEAFLAHTGGDEFVFVIERTTSSDDVVKFADLVLRTLCEPFAINDHKIPVSASIGVVERAAGDAEPTELMRAADITLGWAKQRHRGQWAVFDEERYLGELRRHALTADLPAALARGEFTLAYQPLVRLADRRVVGVEALARWQHPRYGMVSPAQFIPLAESTGLIVPIGAHVLELACTRAAAWQRRAGAPFTMSVNLAVAQLRHPGLAATVATTLARTGLSPELLQLEITESVLVGDRDSAVDTLHTLAGTGVQLAIDDFGTGYSSLAYLADLPVHALKLAPGFLRGLDGAGNSNSTILPAIITLSHDLGLTVTAEGVETADQAERLTALRCDLGQGFHLGHPTTPEQITPLTGAG